MGLFGQSSPFDADVEKATYDTNTNDNWSLILDVCDKVSSNPRNAKDCLKAILKRMGHNDPHVVMQAITLLDACVNNCGRPFHLEIASREFETEFRRLLAKAQPRVSLKMRAVLKNWAEGDFRTDPELNLIHALYIKLRLEGYDFSNLGEKPAKSSAKTSLPKDPNVVSSQQEEDDIAKAIELSLKETKGSPRNQAAAVGSSVPNATSGSSSAYPSLYPSFSSSAGGVQRGNATDSPATAANASAPQAQAEPRKVRALYDFEAAEENELTFFTGEILHVLDDSDQNWWKGHNQRGEGLFPSNFVTADLSVDPKRLDINQHQTKNVQFNNEIDELQQKTDAAIAAAADTNQRIEIDAAKIERLLHLLHEANPEDPSQDSEEMLRLEQEVHQMGPLIDAELERVDRKHAQLTQLSSDLVDAINLYHSLMRDDRTALVGSAAGDLGAAYMHDLYTRLKAPTGGLNGPTSLNSQVPMPTPHVSYRAAICAASNATPGNFPLPMPHHAFGMTPYATNMPPTTAPTAHNSPMTTAATSSNSAGYAVGAQPTPLSFQNGHMQLTDVGGQPQINAALPTPALQEQLPPQTNDTNFTGFPQPRYASTTTAVNQILPGMPLSMIIQLQQQQSPYTRLLPLPHPLPRPNEPNDQYPQFMSLPEGTLFTKDPITGALRQMHTPETAAQSRHAQMEPISQAQQQMAAMSLQMGGGGGGGGGSSSSAVPQSFLNQSDTKQNIPIYPQQQ